MSKIYENNNIYLKISTLAKKNHDFIDNKGKKHASLLLLKASKEINITLETEESLKDKDTFMSIINCINQFIEKNHSITHYNLIFSNSNDFKYEIFPIKKDENSPIRLLRKEQIDELDKNNINYIKFVHYVYGGLKTYGNSKRYLFTCYNEIQLNDGDQLKDCEFLIDKNEYKNITLNNCFYSSLRLYLDENKKYDRNVYISAPSIKIFNNDSEMNGILQISNGSFLKTSQNIPWDLSNIDTKVYEDININCHLDKENLVKTLDTIKNIKKITLKNSYAEELGVKQTPIDKNQLYASYNGVNILKELKGKQKEFPMN